MEEVNNNRLIATIFSLIGGIIGTIPWVLIYVYGNMIVAILAVFIAMAAWKGYKLAKGKVDKYVPTIIVIISLISITIATFIIIPALLLLKEGNSVDINTIKQLYEYKSFARAISGDYIISIIFTLLGISGVISNMKNQVETGKEINLLSYTTITEEEKTIIREAFEKIDAFEKYNAKPKSLILEQLKDNDIILLNKFINRGIVRRYKGNYYYSDKFANNPDKERVKSSFKLVLYVFIILIIIAIIGSLLSDNNNNNNDNNIYEDETITLNEVIQDNIIKYNVPSNFIEVEKYRKERTYYYTPKIDKTGYSGIISASYGTTDYSLDEYDEFKQILKETYIDIDAEDVISSEMKEFTNGNGYKVVEITTEYQDETYPCTEYMYYIVNEKSYGLIYLTDYYSKYVKNIREVAYNMVDKFDFIEGDVTYE